MVDDASSTLSFEKGKTLVKAPMQPTTCAGPSLVRLVVKADVQTTPRVKANQVHLSGCAASTMTGRIMKDPPKEKKKSGKKAIRDW
jgi:hypothetical protein